MDKQRIITNGFGVVNGNTLSVAVGLNFEYSNEVPKGLVLSPTFISGNDLPVGIITPFNTFYDEEVGVYWFDLKVNPVSGPVKYGFETTGKIGDETYPIRFTIDVNGETKAVVSHVQFDKNILQYNVGTKEGKCLRHPLTALATRGLSRVAEGVERDNTAAYGWGAKIDNSKEQTFAVLGSIDIDGVRHNYLARVVTPVITGSIVIEQTKGNRLHAKVTLDKTTSPSINFPISYVGNDVNGISNSVDNLSSTNKSLSFDIPISTVRNPNRYKVETVINCGGFPLFLETFVPVFIWNNNQTDIEVTKISDRLVKNVRTLVLQLNWANGEPVTDLQIIMPDIGPNQIKITTDSKGIWTFINQVDLENGVEKTFTLAGVFDLSMYGVSKPQAFKYELVSGNNALPARVMHSNGYAMDTDGTILIQLAVRKNNGDIFSGIKAESISMKENQLRIMESGYDADNGIIAIKVSDPGTILYPGGIQPFSINLELADGDNFFNETVKENIGVDVHYKVYVTSDMCTFTKKPNGKVELRASWSLIGNDKKRPGFINITGVKLNNLPTEYKKQYNSTSGILYIFIECDPSYLQDMTVSVTGSVRGVDSFLNIPYVIAKYVDPGSIYNLDNKVVTIDGKTRLVSRFKVNGFGYDSKPGSVELNDQAWVLHEGIYPRTAKHIYDKETGILTIAFDVSEDSKKFLANNTIKFSGITLPVVVDYIVE